MESVICVVKLYISLKHNQIRSVFGGTNRGSKMCCCCNLDLAVKKCLITQEGS